MLKRVITASVLALAFVGIGGAAQADDNGDPDCSESVVFIGGVTSPSANCQDTFSSGHKHCPIYAVAVGITCK